jgi:hypothetical protein
MSPSLTPQDDDAATELLKSAGEFCPADTVDSVKSVFQTKGVLAMLEAAVEL